MESEHTKKGKKCVEAIAAGVATKLGLTSVNFEWGPVDKNLSIPLRISTDQGKTEPAIRLTLLDIHDSCNPANPSYEEVQKIIKSALERFSPSRGGIGFV